MSKIPVNSASEIYASYTLNKIDPDVLATMSEEQIAAIKAALLASEKGSRHKIDIRFSIPLYFARYYVAFFAGRDRRRSTYLAELYKQQQGNKQASRIFIWFFMILIGIGFAVFIGLYNYYAKSESGIDIFSNLHLSDVISNIFK